MKPQEFINLIKQGAIESYKQYKILPSITIAQAALESAWGEKHIQYNLFGIKWTEGCGYDKVARETTEYINGVPQKVIAYFRGYKNFNESILDHARLLTITRYEKVRQAKDYKEAAKALQECGYATDPRYAEKLISIIEQYRLYQVDEEVENMVKDITLKLKIGSNEMYKNGTKIILDVPPKIENNRTLVPIRAIAEALGAKVEWNSETQEITINF